MKFANFANENDAISTDLLGFLAAKIVIRITIMINPTSAY